MEKLKLGKAIYDFLINHVGGEAKNIKGLERTERIRLKSNMSNMTWQRTSRLLKDNGINGELILFTSNGKITLKIN